DAGLDQRGDLRLHVARRRIDPQPVTIGQVRRELAARAVHAVAREADALAVEELLALGDEVTALAGRLLRLLGSRLLLDLAVASLVAARRQREDTQGQRGRAPLHPPHVYPPGSGFAGRATGPRSSCIPTGTCRKCRPKIERGQNPVNVYGAARKSRAGI